MRVCVSARVLSCACVYECGDSESFMISFFLFTHRLVSVDYMDCPGGEHGLMGGGGAGSPQ